MVVIGFKEYFVRKTVELGLVWVDFGWFKRRGWKNGDVLFFRFIVFWGCNEKLVFYIDN